MVGTLRGPRGRKRSIARDLLTKCLKFTQALVSREHLGITSQATDRCGAVDTPSTQEDRMFADMCFCRIEFTVLRNVPICPILPGVEV